MTPPFLKNSATSCPVSPKQLVLNGVHAKLSSPDHDNKLYARVRVSTLAKAEQTLSYTFDIEWKKVSDHPPLQCLWLKHQ